MSFAEMEGPPAKRRRFFTERSEGFDSSLTEEAIADVPDELDALPPTSIEKTESPEETNVHDVSTDSSTAGETLPSSFKETLENFIGSSVAPDVIKKLQEASRNDIERAVNMYFDGSWKETVVVSGLRTKGTVDSFMKPTNGSKERETNDSTPEDSPRAASPRRTMPEYRYIGAFGVGGWATKSGTTLIKHGEIVRIERQKIQPPKTLIGKGKGRPTVAQAPKPNSAAAKRVDVIVRFTNSKGFEVGRLPRETANWVSTLIDQKVCKFEGTCVYAPERIRTNDTIFLQLRCSLLRTAFDDQSFKAPDNRKTGLFEEKETAEEKVLRLRQVALVKLFEEINLLPTQTSEATARHKRQGLLNATEAAEHYDKDDSKTPDSTGSSPPSEEAEEGKELEQDQLDTLYSKAQAFDFNAPEAEPADTFAMDLRPYQKQALHWMMSKERDQKDEKREASMHPLWEEYAWPTKDMEDKEVLQVAGQDKFYVNPYSGALSLKFPVQEQHCLGGILADEMGLGKTIEMMSLIHSNKSDVAMRLDEQRSKASSVNMLPRLPANSSSVERAPCTTLVVAPMSLLAQWQSEAENASKDGTMKSIVYYGNDKTANLQALCCEANAAAAPNVVITSYGVVLSEFNQVAARNGDRGGHGGLFSLSFFRVILDEAHHIKNRQSKTAKACKYTKSAAPIFQSNGVIWWNHLLIQCKAMRLLLSIDGHLQEPLS
jgi:DNA repair protein RAD5